jgi:glutamine synthetase
MKHPENSNGGSPVSRFLEAHPAVETVEVIFTDLRDCLGADFQQAMAAIKRAEQEEFSGAVTSLEYDSYLVLA